MVESVAAPRPAWSVQALANRDLFFQRGYGVHVFVEDEDKESLYELILGRLFEWGKSLKVFPLGGKSAVIAHAMSENDGSAVRIYLLDKDFDDLHERKVERENVFYLDDYCIEGSLIDIGSITCFAIDESPTMRKEVISGRLGYRNFLRSCLGDLDRLHRMFFLVQKYEIPLKNSGLSVQYFCEGDANGCRLSQAKIDAYCVQLYEALAEKGIVTSREELDSLMDSAFARRSYVRANISGRYLLAILVSHMRHVGLLKAAVRIDSLAVRLARTSKLRRFNGVRGRIGTYLVGLAA